MQHRMKHNEIILRKKKFYRITKDSGVWCGDYMGKENEISPQNYSELDDGYNLIKRIKHGKI